jgi:predicted DNA-binding transcriptional regulator AlpA
MRPLKNRRLEPRCLSREEAADYVGVSPSLFDQMVRDGRMPGPICINARRVWDRYKLDDAINALVGDNHNNPWDDAA